VWSLWLGVAHAFEMGTTIGLGGGLDLGEGPGGLAFPPSLDLYFEPIVLQIHVLDTLNAAFDEDLYVGANLYVHVAEQPVGGGKAGEPRGRQAAGRTAGCQAVIQPGASLDIWGDPTSIGVAVESRFGAQVKETAGFGFYLVPALGFVTSGGRAEPFAGGTLQLAVWYGM
jgi:hypothetical protein